MRRTLPTALAALAVVLTACGGESEDPAVTFYADGEAVRTGPAQYCDVAVTTCDEHPDAVARLAVRPGSPVQISVDDAIAEAPWQVVFRYRAGAEAVEGRTPLFAADERLAYTLEVPDGGQLEALEVQQFGLPALDEGVPTFLVRGTWSLSAERS